MGRLVVWTKSAFECLDSIFGGGSVVSGRLHNQRSYSLPQPLLVNSDIDMILESDSVQAMMTSLKESHP